MDDERNMKQSLVGIANPNYRHGKRHSKVYNTWQHILNRCRNKRAKAYKNYGGRGIVVCDRWLVFVNFYADMGDPPTATHSIERVNNDKGYSPDNCKWATRDEQANNTRRSRKVTLNGRTQTVVQWERELNIPRNRIYNRLRRGLSDADSLSLSLFAYGPQNPLKGELVPVAKLTEVEARKILSYKNSGIRQRDVGLMFGVSQTTVCDIQRGRRWGHLQ